MSSTKYENQILDAIETVAKKAIETVGYDKTIRGVISSLEDVSTGKYKVKYQDSEIEAYSNNTSMKYSKGTLVNILVPNNDFSQNKIIIDAIDKGNIEYNTVVEEANQYVVDGGNAIFATQEFGLCSYHENEIIYLYDRDNGINDINFDKIIFAENLKNNNKILCGAKFRTDFDSVQKRIGNFGIVYNIEFKNNSTGDIITKTYVIDVNSMVGSPYDLTIPTKQYNIYQIDNKNYYSVKSIYIFSKDFESVDPEKKQNDIFVSDFELSALREPTQQEAEGYSLQLTKKNKGYFDKTSDKNSAVTIEAILKLNNSINTTTKIEYYWFKENSDIDINNQYYVNYAGKGWECLNEANTTDDNESMWITQYNTYNVMKTLCTNAVTKIRCIAIKDNSILAENTIVIYNYQPDYKIEIISDQGTQFYFDNGNPTLTCIIDGVEELEDYTYQWSYIDINGENQVLEETTADNTVYNWAISDYEMLLAKIESEVVMPAASQDELDDLKAVIDNYTYVQRVDKNKICHLDLSNIIDETVFKCMVKKDGSIIGTAEVTIKNTLNIEGNYTLNIVNGTQVFNYDFNGISPTSSTLDKPIQIEPLSIELLDNLGNKIGDNILPMCDIQWEVPQENTLLIGENSKNLTLNYQIAEKFDNNKLYNNNIKLTIIYNNLTLEAYTHFTFAKDGEPGTNGTGVICKILPNTDEILTQYPKLRNGVLNFTPSEEGKWFKAQLWKNGEKIYEGTDSNEDYIVTWSILKNIYEKQENNIIQDAEIISVEDGIFSYNNFLDCGASIIKVQIDYEDHSYYCTLPIIIVDIIDENYDIDLVGGTGFKYVMYSSNGERPQYDNTTPFEIKVTQMIDGYAEDVSTISNEYQVSYEWAIQGQIYNIDSQAFIDDTHLSFDENTELAQNQKILVPNEQYDGENVTNALEVKILNRNLIEKGRILIPIHLYLDRYGLANLNNWDGNKISIDDDMGSILSPQVGAGKKEDDNSFTGVLIGSVKERQSDKVEQGLFGYSKGQRSIFLDAQTGKAEFGKNNAAKIIIDPTLDKAQLYSGNYKDGTSGMLIDLTTPEIKWGNGNFVVDENGYVVAKGGGSIGGWEIRETSLYSSGITIDSTGSIYGDGNGNDKYKWSIDRGLATFNNINAAGGHIGGCTIDAGGIWSGDNGNTAGLGLIGARYAFWAGGYENDSGNAKFHVGHDGTLVASGATINGNITATTGRIAGYTIDGNMLKGTKVGMSGHTSQGWAFWAGSDTPGSAAFRVNHSGTVYCSNMRISGGSITLGDYFVVKGRGDITIRTIKISNNTSIDAEGILHKGKMLYWDDLAKLIYTPI